MSQISIPVKAIQRNRVAPTQLQVFCACLKEQVDVLDGVMSRMDGGAYMEVRLVFIEHEFPDEEVKTGAGGAGGCGGLKP